LLHAPLRRGQFLAGLARLGDRKGRLRAPRFVDVAAAVEVRLRHYVGLRGALARFRVDQHDFQRLIRSFPPEIRHLEMHKQCRRMQRNGQAERRAEDAVTPGEKRLHGAE
jgi:hypothetical protein